MRRRLRRPRGDARAEAGGHDGRSVQRRRGRGGRRAGVGARSRARPPSNARRVPGGLRRGRRERRDAHVRLPPAGRAVWERGCARADVRRHRRDTRRVALCGPPACIAVQRRGPPRATRPRRLLHGNRAAAPRGAGGGRGRVGARRPRRDADGDGRKRAGRRQRRDDGVLHDGRLDADDVVAGLDCLRGWSEQRLARDADGTGRGLDGSSSDARVDRRRGRRRQHRRRRGAHVA
mmetsp:Transcript_22775/g.79576  ORF Transcript_22775/g.79576 Transcript_22775/m.79576 type:complete len:234 (-) Transcript_22775:565-1266(-)